MIFYCRIPIRLPGMNTIIAAAKAHHFKYSSMKKEWTGQCAIFMPMQKAPLEGRATVQMEWYEKKVHETQRRDIDNIAAGSKFILDALVMKQVIKNDSPEFVEQIIHKFHHNQIEDRVEVSVWVGKTSK